MTEEKFQEHLLQAAKLGAHIALKDAGLPVVEYYTRTEMARRHGAGNINRLIKAGKLTPHRLTATNNEETKRILYSETELLSLII